MFEVLAGDVFDRGGEKLTVFKIRIESMGEATRVLVHFVEGSDVRIRPAEAFTALLREGLADGSITNVNRPADFGGFGP